MTVFKMKFIVQYKYKKDILLLIKIYIHVKPFKCARIVEKNLKNTQKMEH